MLRSIFAKAGFLVVSCYTHDIRDGNVDFDAFIRQHRPRVIVYDLAPPYDPNVRLFRQGLSFRAHQRASGKPTLVASDKRIHEVVDREPDLMRLVQMVKEASLARPTR